MARRFNKRATQLHDVTYPGFPKRTLHIIIDNYQIARQGNEGMQKSIIRQYKAVADVPEGRFLEWNKLSLKAVGIVVPATPEIKKPNKRKPVGAPISGPANRTSAPKASAKTVSKPETYGCTCEAANCGACDQGWHHSCRYGCKHGQVVHTR